MRNNEYHMTTLKLNTITHDEAINAMLSGFKLQLESLEEKIVEAKAMLAGKDKATAHTRPPWTPARKKALALKLKAAWKKRKAAAGKGKAA